MSQSTNWYVEKIKGTYYNFEDIDTGYNSRFDGKLENDNGTYALALFPVNDSHSDSYYFYNSGNFGVELGSNFSTFDGEADSALLKPGRYVLLIKRYVSST